MFNTPTIADFKAYFFRDFPYSNGDASDLSVVQDQDITNALTDAGVNINQDLFGSQQTFSMAYLNLSAHYMTMSLRASAQGIAGRYSWLMASKGAGSVSEGFQVPQRILDNPYFAMLSQTRYGAKYLEIILPLTRGAMFSVCGGTQP